jgi:hypothetical protein
MLTIRKAQYQVFREEAYQDFARRMVAHLRKCFPQQASAMPEAELSGLVAHGRMRSESYGIILEEDVKCFLELMMRYGREFDTAQKTNWAGQILRTRRLKGSEKVVTLRKFSAKQKDANGANCG